MLPLIPLFKTIDLIFKRDDYFIIDSTKLLQHRHYIW